MAGRLALVDPNADPTLIDQLTTDPDETIRWQAASCPRLPATRAVTLLDDAELMGAAAANPALPVPAMLLLVDQHPAEPA